MKTIREHLAEDPWLAAIVGSSDDAILTEDLGGVITSWNKAAERLVGYIAAEVVGPLMIVVFPPDRAAEGASVIERIERGELVDYYETDCIHKDGQNIRVGVTISPVIGADGKIIGSLTMLRDLTDRDTRDRRIQELEAEVARLQRLVEVSHMMSALVHEVSEPLTAIVNYANAFRHLTTTDDQEKVQAAIQRIVDQSNRPREIVRRIRDYARKGDARVPLDSSSHVMKETSALESSNANHGTSGTLRPDWILPDS